MKKKLCALLLAVLTVVPLSGCVSFITASVVYHSILPDNQEYAAVVKANWDISLPSGFELLFSESEAHPRGEGPRYGVLRYADEAALDGFREWTEVVGPTRYCGSYTELVEETIEELVIPEESYPDYEQALWWYSHATDEDPRDEILMLRNGATLYIIEGFY